MEYIFGGYQGPEAKDRTLSGQQPQCHAIRMFCSLCKVFEYLMDKDYFWSLFCEHFGQRP